MTYKVGIVGYGVVGKRRHSAIKKIPGFKVTALSDISFGEESKFEGLKCYSDFKDLIDDKTIDVLFISLPNNFAAEATLMGLKRGMHVFCEKPPAKSLRELKPIENFMKDSNLKLMYGFNHRFHSSIIKAKQIIDRYELGKIINCLLYTSPSPRD